MKDFWHAEFFFDRANKNFSEHRGWHDIIRKERPRNIVTLWAGWAKRKYFAFTFYDYDKIRLVQILADSYAFCILCLCKTKTGPCSAQSRDEGPLLSLFLVAGLQQLSIFPAKGLSSEGRQRKKQRGEGRATYLARLLRAQSSVAQPLFLFFFNQPASEQDIYKIWITEPLLLTIFQQHIFFINPCPEQMLGQKQLDIFRMCWVPLWVRRGAQVGGRKRANQKPGISTRGFREGGGLGAGARGTS